MTEKRFYAEQLDEADIAYLAHRYDFDADFVRGLNDDDWSSLLGCGLDELPFYLFDEDTFDEYLAERQDLADDYDFGDDDGGGLFDLNYEIERQLSQPALAPTPPTNYRPKVSAVQHNYSSPSRFGKKPKPIVVKHHFELVH